MTKTCPRCTTEKPRAEFGANSARSDGLQTYCKDCTNAYNSQYYATNEKLRLRTKDKNRKTYARNREYIFQFLSTRSCVDCGEDDPIVLEFDHVDPSNKAADISNLVRHRVSLAKLQEEIDKCVVRCANCHRRKTAIQFGYYSSRGVG